MIPLVTLALRRQVAPSSPVLRSLVWRRAKGRFYWQSLGTIRGWILWEVP